MRGLEAEETSSAQGGDGLSKSESQEHAEADGNENCCDEKTETQVNLYGKCTLRQPLLSFCPEYLLLRVTFVSWNEEHF